MTSDISASVSRLIELATLADDLRAAFGALVAAKAALLEAGARLDAALASGSDGTAALADLEREAGRHAAARETLRDLAPVVSRMLDGSEKTPSESSVSRRAQADA